MKKGCTRYILFAIAAFAVIFAFRFENDIAYLKLKYDQEICIEQLIETSARLRGYSLRDGDAGRVFGITREVRYNPFYVVASMFSGRSIFPTGDSEFSLVFPVCAKNQPAFYEVLSDLQEPTRLFSAAGEHLTPEPADLRSYNIAKKYFVGELNVIRRIGVIYINDCSKKYILSEPNIVVEKMYVNVPARSTVYLKN